MQAMIRTDALSFSYPVEEGQRRTTALEDVTLSIEKGSFVVVLGHNGSGKSTLAKLIAGIQTPTSGQILFDGQDITGASITDRANLGISFAFQQPVRFKGITVLDLLRLAAKKRLSVGEACNYLSEVGLCAKDYVNREVNASLSGGELKRIEIATVLARGTRLSIFDEPEAGIDLWSFAMLVESFRSMCKNRYETVIVISHQERIMQLADEMIVVEKGKIRTRGTKEEILPQLLGELEESCDFNRKDGE